jgi:2-polyprenyl-6-methoxyphenol hydroxylase-like FAD-dependent oxidoreductase
MKILISGAGIAGPTLAHWLSRYGHHPTLLEKAPALRRGGYVVDFWGTGYDVAERMGILPELKDRGYEMQEVRVVDRAGKRVSGFPASAIRELVGGRFTSLPQGELAAAIYESLGGKVETLFGRSLASLEQKEDRVRVTLEGGETRDFDLVVGADGLHSRVRELAFGPQGRYEKFLGYKVAAF